MKTIYITIGNCDNKLPQHRWHYFCHDLEVSMKGYVTHFRGYSLPNAPFQTMCICVEAPDDDVAHIRAWLATLAQNYRQDSIALAIADVELVRA